MDIYVNPLTYQTFIPHQAKSGEFSDCWLSDPGNKNLNDDQSYLWKRFLISA